MSINLERLSERSEKIWNSRTPKYQDEVLSKLRKYLDNDHPADWLYYVRNHMQYTTCTPTFHAIWLWNKYTIEYPTLKYDLTRLAELTNWEDRKEAFVKKLYRLEPAPYVDYFAKQTPMKSEENIMYNEKPIAKPTLIFGKDVTKMNEAEFLSAIQRLEERKKTIVSAQESGSSSYLNTQIKEVNNAIAEVIQAMDKNLE